MRLFIIAIAGTGMGTLAGLLKELGHDVAGSDVAFHPPMGPALKEWGIKTFDDFAAVHLDGRAHDGHPPDAVIVGNVCRKNNVEVVEAERLGLTRLHIADALKQFALQETSSLVVTGTHGKTTTSALCAHLLREVGVNPGFLIGGVPISLGVSFSRADSSRVVREARRTPGRSTPFVLEGDEYDTAFWEKSAKFLHYQADVAIITSIEHDHIDIYPSLDDYLSAFRQFIEELPSSGLILAYAGDPLVVELVADAPCEVAFYALEGEEVHDVSPHFLAVPVDGNTEGSLFDLFNRGELAGRFVTPLSGAHNLRNTIAALGAATQGYGVPLAQMREPLASFQGIKRRQELRGKPNGVFVYDDFAHHPTAVRETLKGLRIRHPEGRLIAVFEPRSATACRSLHQTAYESAFDAADSVIFAPVGRPEIPDAEKLNLPSLVEVINFQKEGVHAPKAAYFSDVESITDSIVHLAKPGDIVAVLSNGSFGGIHEKLLAALSAASPISQSGEVLT